MSCCYCTQGNLNESRNYNIENVRGRFIPTYFHSQIFGTTQPLPSKVRCTPTFHSQALRVDKYGHKCKGICHQKVPTAQKKAIQQVDTKKTAKKGDFCNARGKSCYNSRVKWYDEEKNEKFNHIHNNYDYSKQRKFADLASSSVFEGYVYQPQCVQNKLCQCVNCKCGKAKAKWGECQCDQSYKNNQNEQLQKNEPSCKNCKCTNCACDNCQCGPKEQEFQKNEKTCQCKNCNCVDCKCVSCNGENCKRGVSQVNPQNKIQEPKITIHQKNEQVTFGKKGTKLQKGISQNKRAIKEKPSFTVIRQKR